MRHIAFLLLLVAVLYLSLENTVGFWDVFREKIKFGRIGYKLIEGKFLRLMGRINHTGIVVSNASPKSYYDWVDAKINFVVPSIAVILRNNESLQPIMPGVITSILDKISNGGNNFKSFILEIDGKKNCRGKGKLMGGKNMWDLKLNQH